MHFLQIWIVPDEKNTTPGYQQVSVPDSEKRGQLRLIVSPDGSNGALRVRQDVKIYAGLFDGDEQQTFALGQNRYAYIHVARVRDEASLTFSGGDQAEVLLFDLRPLEVNHP